MKKIISILIALTVISGSSMAQTEKGKVLLGGYLDFSSMKVNNESKSRTNFGINPTAGFFISDNLVIGTGVGYAYSSYPQNNGTNGTVVIYQQHENSVKISPFGRYYVGITPQIKFFGHLEASVNWVKFKADGPPGKVIEDSNIKSNFYSTSLSPGFAIFPSKKIGIELSFSGLYFSKQNWKSQDAKSDTRSFGIGSDFFNPRLGMQFYL
jgi:hypothetical protein